MARECRAIEQCTYCREYVPVTWYRIPKREGAQIWGEMPICQECGDGREGGSSISDRRGADPEPDG